MTDRIDAIAAKIREKKFSEARELADSVLSGEVSNARAWHLKGVALLGQEMSGDAIFCFNQALKHRFDFKEACLDLAGALEGLGRFTLAVRAYEHWLKIERMPVADKVVTAADAERLHALRRKAELLYPARRYGEAEQLLLDGLRTCPVSAAVLTTLGACYSNTGHYAKAIACWRQALAVEPRYPLAAVNLGNIWFELQDYDEAIRAYEQALFMDPRSIHALASILHLSHRLCRWEKLGELRARMERMMSDGHAMQPFLAVTLVTSAEAQCENAKRFVTQHFTAWRRHDPAAVLPADTRGGAKLRIGYLSSDLHDHATSRLVAELFERHDRERFEIFAYSHGSGEPGAMRTRIEQSVDRFCDIRMTDDAEAAARMREDGIDVLVDLKGHTQGHRLSLMALRPAPIQMHYLGFPGTIGADFIDYFLTDAIASPAGADGSFNERLIRLPHSYQMNDRKRFLPDTAPSRSALGLPEQGAVLCCFNNSYKITPEIFSVWMRLLQKIEGSVLWLYETHAESSQNLRREAQAKGVNPARIVMAGKLPQSEHLARYLHADLVLDTAPVGGHTTTSDALWCGAPVLTCAGESFVSRVAASLLHAVGLAELVAGDLATYESFALELASDREKLAGLRRHLEKGRMQFPLFDSASTARALESAYLQAVEFQRSGKPPQSFSI